MLDNKGIENYNLLERNKCPLCKSPKSTIWDKNENNRIKALQCYRCKLVFMDKIISNEDLNKYYSGYNIIRDNNYKKKKLLRKISYKQDYDFLLNYISDKGIILDIGCGFGDFLSLFNKTTKKIGYEVDLEAIKKGRSNYTNIQFIDSYNELKKLKNIDTIIFRGSFQYLRHINSTLKLCYNILKHNGILSILSLPNATSPLAMIQKEDWSMCNKIEHIHLFSPTSINYMLKNKFKIIHMDYPYIGTPYEDHEKDLESFIDICSKKKKPEETHFPFWGSLIHLIAKKVL